MSSKPPCRFFAQGTCRKGDACDFSHTEGNRDPGSKERGGFNNSSGDFSRGRGMRGSGRGFPVRDNTNRPDQNTSSFGGESFSRGKSVGRRGFPDSEDQSNPQFQRGNRRGGNLIQTTEGIPETSEVNFAEIIKIRKLRIAIHFQEDEEEALKEMVILKAMIIFVVLEEDLEGLTKTRKIHRDLISPEAGTQISAK
jgi:hypothetical protein